MKRVLQAGCVVLAVVLGFAFAVGVGATAGMWLCLQSWLASHP